MVDLFCVAYFLQEGIQPMWEDKTNKDGGRWLLNLDKKERKEGVLDGVWMETVSDTTGQANV